MEKNASTKPSQSNPKSPRARLFGDLVVDLIATSAIVAALVLFLNETLESILTSPIFIVLVSAGLAHVFYKYFKRRRSL